MVVSAPAGPPHSPPRCIPFTSSSSTSTSLLNCPGPHSLKAGLFWLPVPPSCTVMDRDFIIHPLVGCWLCFAWAKLDSSPTWCAQDDMDLNCKAWILFLIPYPITDFQVSWPWQSVNPRGSWASHDLLGGLSPWTMQTSRMIESSKPLSSDLWLLPEETKTSDHGAFAMSRGRPHPSLQRVSFL